jgi:hypothetical protein
MPSVTLHPSGEYFCGQSMDNTIATYSCSHDKVRAFRKKTFRGHNNSGYACQVAFSPDGHYVASGDGQGKLTFWDWKTGKVRTEHSNIWCVSKCACVMLGLCVCAAVPQVAGARRRPLHRHRLAPAAAQLGLHVRVGRTNQTVGLIIKGLPYLPLIDSSH